MQCSILFFSTLPTNLPTRDNGDFLPFWMRCHRTLPHTTHCIYLRIIVRKKRGVEQWHHPIRMPIGAAIKRRKWHQQNRRNEGCGVCLLEHESKCASTLFLLFYCPTFLSAESFSGSFFFPSPRFFLFIYLFPPRHPSIPLLFFPTLI